MDSWRCLSEMGILFVFPILQVFKQANAFLQSPDGPATPETSSSTSQIGAADGAIEAVGQGGKESVLGARLESAAVVGGGAGEGALPLPTVDLDLLDQEVGLGHIFQIQPSKL